MVLIILHINTLRYTSKCRLPYSGQCTSKASPRNPTNLNTKPKLQKPTDPTQRIIGLATRVISKVSRLVLTSTPNESTFDLSYEVP